MSVRWSPHALDRVMEIAVYIAQDSPQAAEAWVDRVFGAVEQLDPFPSSGKPGRDIVPATAREFVFESYRVFYDVTDSGVEVLTVRRCSEQIDPDELTRD